MPGDTLPISNTAAEDDISFASAANEGEDGEGQGQDERASAEDEDEDAKAPAPEPKAPSEPKAPREHRQRTSTLDALPPSPPLTRPCSLEDPPADPHAAAALAWHPLARPRDSADLDFSLTHSQDQDRDRDTTLQNTETEEGSAPTTAEEKPRPLHRPPAPPQLRVTTDRGAGKVPPTPWEGEEPPDEEHYNTKRPGGKTFSALMKTRSRPQVPHSSYYFGPPPVDAAYGTNPVGRIGEHHPREVFRVERDYTGGELVQFSTTYPLELEGRITHTQFLETVNAINELLISAHSIRHSLVNNVLAVITLQASRLIVIPHYDKEMLRLEHLIADLNAGLYNPVGLHIRWPRDVAFMFLEIEYY
ncbi:hypothetical protein FIBSPDRAFT_867502 [Athelia psychrophila]|uniref:Ras modification protein ERF4 n=1 Tax=Athelia psychrophila TaxID=1759441 RepID=A0A166DZ49_9AGAM|nr:hypothetical protein FIBSPDRAFT_867502 [Fibularhizoctonia sp. CBS 109695]